MPFPFRDPLTARCDRRTEAVLDPGEVSRLVIFFDVPRACAQGRLLTAGVTHRERRLQCLFQVVGGWFADADAVILLPL